MDKASEADIAVDSAAVCLGMLAVASSKASKRPQKG